MKFRLITFLSIFYTLTFSAFSFAQTVSFQATSSAFKVPTDSLWSNYQEIDATIKMDIDNSQFSLFSTDTSFFTITENEGMTTNSDGDDTYSYFCTDNNGIICRIRLMILHSQEEIMQLYLDYNDSNWFYNISTHNNNN